MRERGGGWVVGQFVLIFVIVASSRLPPRIHSSTLHWLGLGLAFGGIAVALWAYRVLGNSFTIFPQPREAATLVTRGPFALVRHPVYLGGLLFFAGFSLRFSWLALALTAALAVLWAAKARVEERYLTEQFPEYVDYRSRVHRRLMPFVF